MCHYQPGNLLKSKTDDTTSSDGRPMISAPMGNIDFGMSMGVECTPIEELNAERNAESDDPNDNSTEPKSYVNVEVGAEVEVKGQSDTQDDPKIAAAKPQRPPAPKVSPKPDEEATDADGGNKSIRQSLVIGKKRIRSMFNKSETKGEMQPQPLSPSKTPPPSKPPRPGRGRAVTTTGNFASDQSVCDLDHTYTEVELVSRVLKRKFEII